MATALGVTQTKGEAFPVQTIINGTVVESPVQAYGTFTTPLGLPNTSACDQIKDTLLAAGWALTQNVQAVGGITGPLGWGYGGVTLAISFGIFAASYVYYNPASGLPPYVPGVMYVPDGPGALGNLVAAINSTAGVPVVALAVTSSQIQLTAIPPGTSGNSIVVTGNGATSIGENPKGGGWSLTSRAQTVLLGGVGNETTIGLIATTGAPGLPDRLAIAVTVNGFTVNFYAKSGSWQLIASSFSACFLGDTVFEGGDIYVDNSFLWAATLYVAGDLAEFIDDAAFIMQTANSPVGPSLGFPTGMTVDCFAGGNHSSTVIGERGWSIAMFYTGEGLITDPTGMPLIEIPWVMMPAGYVAQARICGQIFDCFASSAPADYGEQYTQQGYNFRCVASQSTGSLLLKTGEVDNLGTPAASNAGNGTSSPNPVTNPTSAVGTGDVGFTSPTLGTLVQASGTASFSSSWDGKPIMIGGAAYTVNAVASPTVLTFSPVPAAAAFGVPWSFQS